MRFFLLLLLSLLSLLLLLLLCDSHAPDGSFGSLRGPRRAKLQQQRSQLLRKRGLLSGLFLLFIIAVPVFADAVGHVGGGMSQDLSSSGAQSTVFVR